MQPIINLFIQWKMVPFFAFQWNFASIRFCGISPVEILANKSHLQKYNPRELPDKICWTQIYRKTFFATLYFKYSRKIPENVPSIGSNWSHLMLKLLNLGIFVWLCCFPVSAFSRVLMNIKLLSTFLIIFEGASGGNGVIYFDQSLNTRQYSA